MDMNSFISIAAKYAVPALIALIVFWIGRAIANKISNSVEKTMMRGPNADLTLSRFFASIVKYLLLFLVIMISLSILGVNVASFTGLLAGLGGAMAFILQGSLSNVAAGVMMMLFRPFSKGDIVEAGGSTGTVEAITLTATRLKTVDNVEIIVANSKIWGGTVKNQNGYDLRRVDMDFGIDYDADIDKASKAIKDAALAQPQALSTPEPWIKVVNLGDSSVDLQLRVWCKSTDYKALKAGLSQPVKAALDKAGIGIPYPHEIKIKQSVKTSKARDRITKLRALREKNA